MPATITRDYLSLDAAKDQLSLTNTSLAERDLLDAISAASRDIDDRTHRRFYPDPDAEQVRFYSPQRSGGFEIDDLIELTSLEVGSSGVFSEWTEGTDFLLEPLNAAADYRPWERVVVLRPSLTSVWAPGSVRVTGQFGWAEIPAGVINATKILAARFLLRTREAPFGVVSAGLESGAVMRVAARDPDAALLGLVRETLIA